MNESPTLLRSFIVSRVVREILKLIDETGQSEYVFAAPRSGGLYNLPHFYDTTRPYSGHRTGIFQWTTETLNLADLKASTPRILFGDGRRA